MQTYGCCFSGYRPEKFDFEFGADNLETRKLRVNLVIAITKLIAAGVTEFYCGCAKGFDIFAAEVLLEASEYRKDIHLHCVIPFPDAVTKLDDHWRKRLEEVMSYSDSCICLNKSYHPGVYAVRNRYMVDNSLFVLTYYDGKPGGTKSTLEYAIEKRKKIINLVDEVIPDITLPLRYPYYIVEEDPKKNN